MGTYSRCDFLLHCILACSSVYAVSVLHRSVSAVDKSSMEMGLLPTEHLSLFDSRMLHAPDLVDAGKKYRRRGSAVRHSIDMSLYPRHPIHVNGGSLRCVPFA